jgi:hypothetical protein
MHIDFLRTVMSDAISAADRLWLRIEVPEFEDFLILPWVNNLGGFLMLML